MRMWFDEGLVSGFFKNVDKVYKVPMKNINKDSKNTTFQSC